MESVPSEGPDRSFLENYNRCGKSSGAKHYGKVTRLFGCKTSRNPGVTSRNFFLYHGSRINLVVQNYCKAFLDIFFRNIFEYPRSFFIEIY